MAAPNTTPLSTLSSVSAPSSAEPSVQTLHQGNLELQRQILQQKLAAGNADKFTSPTDQMMTPCSKKLQDHKKKAFGKTKPRSLFAKTLAEGKENKSVSPPANEEK